MRVRVCVFKEKVHASAPHPHTYRTPSIHQQTMTLFFWFERSASSIVDSFSFIPGAGEECRCFTRGAHDAWRAVLFGVCVCVYTTCPTTQQHTVALSCHAIAQHEANSMFRHQHTIDTIVIDTTQHHEPISHSDNSVQKCEAQGVFAVYDMRSARGHFDSSVFPNPTPPSPPSSSSSHTLNPHTNPLSYTISLPPLSHPLVHPLILAWKNYRRLIWSQNH